MKTHTLLIALAASSFALSDRASGAVTAYAIADNGTSLISFDLANPSVTTLVGAFTTSTGAAIRLDGIDFRPLDGLLYGYSQETNSVVTINTATASTALASAPSTASNTRNLGIDFNPVADRLRLVNGDDQNLRTNVVNGVTLVDGPLTYAAGDPNAGANPGVNEAAYTNSDNNAATGTTLYYIDPALDTLVSTTNPNGGTLNTVGALGVATSDLTGFDILSDGLGANTAYALLTAQSGAASLYTVNLTTGAATYVDQLSQTAASRPYSLAITQNLAVPESGSGATLMGIALAGVVATRRWLTVRGGPVTA